MLDEIEKTIVLTKNQIGKSVIVTLRKPYILHDCIC